MLAARAVQASSSTNFTNPMLPNRSRPPEPQGFNWAGMAGRGVLFGCREIPTLGDPWHIPVPFQNDPMGPNKGISAIKQPRASSLTSLQSLLWQTAPPPPPSPPCRAPAAMQKSIAIILLASLAMAGLVQADLPPGEHSGSKRALRGSGGLPPSPSAVMMLAVHAPSHLRANIGGPRIALS